MDYWKYLAHSQKGAERDGHKYYARVQTGTNKLGFPQYRYFYDAREYGAYKTREQKGIPENNSIKVKGRTNFISGKGTEGRGFFSAKTVHDYKKPLRKAKQKISGLRKEAAESHNKNRWYEAGYFGNYNRNTITSVNRYTGKTRTATYKGDEAHRKDNEYHQNHSQYGTTQKNRRLAKAERKRKMLEAVYQTDKSVRKAKRKAQKASMDFKRNAKKGAVAVSRLLGHKNKGNSSGTKKNGTSSGLATKSSSGSSARSKHIGEQHSMDRKRLDTQARAAQVKKDAKAYRKKRRAASKATRDGRKRIMDNVRERPYYSPKKV